MAKAEEERLLQGLYREVSSDDNITIALEIKRALAEQNAQDRL
jgi:hypothetical protein